MADMFPQSDFEPVTRRGPVIDLGNGAGHDLVAFPVDGVRHPLKVGVIQRGVHQLRRLRFDADEKDLEKFQTDQRQNRRYDGYGVKSSAAGHSDGGGNPQPGGGSPDMRAARRYFLDLSA